MDIVALEACEHAVEAAFASEELDDLHPRRMFSRQWFAELVTLRRSRSRWPRIEERFDEAVRSCASRLERAA